MTTGVWSATSSHGRAVGEVDRLTWSAGLLTLFLLPIVSLGRGPVSSGAGLALFLLPIALSHLGNYRRVWRLLATWGAALTLSLLLAVDTVAADMGRAMDWGAAWRVLIFVATSGLTFVVMLWCRKMAGIRAVVFVYAAGVLAQVLSAQALAGTAWTTNAWKQALAWPVALMVLAFVRQYGLSIVVLAGLTLVSVAYDYRSFAALCVFTAVLLLRGRPRRDGSTARRKPIATLLLAGVTATVVIQGGTQLALDGRFGERIQQRTLVQTDAGTQSVFVGARPELSGGWALAKERPLGFGAGVVPSGSDERTFLAGLAAVGAATESDYVDTYLLGGRVELHSVGGDLWLHFGFLGLALAGCFAWIIGRELIRRIDAGEAPPFLVAAAVFALWDLLFSPISSLTHVVLALALAYFVVDKTLDGPPAKPLTRPPAVRKRPSSARNGSVESRLRARAGISSSCATPCGILSSQ